MPAMWRWGAARLAVLLMTPVLLVDPAPALAGSGPIAPAAPQCIPGLVASVGSTMNQVTPIGANATVTCAVPSGLPGQPDGPTGPGPQRSFPPVGSPCEVIRDEPDDVVIHADGSVDELSPDENGNQTPFPWPAAVSIIIVDEAAGNQLYVPFEHAGTFGPGGVCLPNGPGGWDNGCAGPVKTDPIIMLTGLSSEQCLHIVPDEAVGGGLPPGVIGPQLLNLEGQVSGLINAGTLSSLPVGAGLVNVPQCFFINGMNTPQNQQFQIVIPSPAADALGRRIFYVFVISVTNAGVTWNFGDNSGDTTGQQTPPDCAAQAATAQVSTAHLYQRYSDGEPGGVFQVQATEHYQIGVTEMWIDATQAGPHVIPVDLAALGVPPEITKPVPAGGAFPQRILQEEGVSVG